MAIVTIIVGHPIKLILGNILIPGAFMSESQSTVITSHWVSQSKNQTNQKTNYSIYQTVWCILKYYKKLYQGKKKNHMREV